MIFLNSQLLCIFITLHLIATSCSNLLSLALKQNECFGVALKGNYSNIACLCDTNHCDKHPFDWPTSFKYVFRAETSKAGKRFKQSTIPVSDVTNNNASIDATIELFIYKRQQQVLGFGGGLTDSVAFEIQSLSSEMRESILEDLFGSSGSSYNLLRTTIGGSDFSTRAYSLADAPNNTEDFDLNYFSLQPEDLDNKIPVLKMAQEKRRAAGFNDSIKVFAVSWSPPVWMKTNNWFVKGSLKPGKKYMDSYARYLIKFLDAYENDANISIFALSPQNEPHTPTFIEYKSNSCEFKPKELREFVENSLIVELKKSNHPNVNLLLWEDDLIGINLYIDELIRSNSIRQIASAVSFHWYSHSLNNLVSLDTIAKVARRLPYNMYLVSTEASWTGKPSPGNWTRGELYARDIIANLQFGTVAWIDWNMALNLTGGFTWCNNILDSSILVNSKNNFYLKSPTYYVLMHFSRFIKSNSHVIQTFVTLTDNQNKTTAETNEQNIFVIGAELSGLFGSMRRFSLVVLNRAKSEKIVKIVANGCASQNGSLFQVSLDAQSLTSFAFNC